MNTKKIKFLTEIPRNLNKVNIENAIRDYKKTLEDVPLNLKGENILDLFSILKRKEMITGPYKGVSLFEAANRIMTDLVILFGIKKILAGEIPDLEIFDEFYVELGNEHNLEHDIVATANGKKLIGEAFNVAPSFFNVKKNKSYNKMINSKSKPDYLILLCNSDSHDVVKEIDGVFIIKVDVKF